jgi:hypothetical protein
VVSLSQLDEAPSQNGCATKDSAEVLALAKSVMRRRAYEYHP